MLGDRGFGSPPRRRGSGNVLTHIIMAVLGAALAIGLLLSFYSPSGGPSLPGSGAVPSPGTSAAPLSGGEQAIVSKVKPGPGDHQCDAAVRQRDSAGTGMVINADGLVLTNNHVIEDSTKITAAVVATGKTYPATVVGYDVTGDVALIQLQDASGLTTVPVGNSSAVRAGDAVVALGNVGGQGSISATAGQVTGLNQTITASNEGRSTASETLNGMIQTNAGIAPGDSGGPLSSPADVIGMDTAGNDASGQQARPPGSPSRSTRRCRSPGRSPRATPVRSSRSATRRSWASSPGPDPAAARRPSSSRNSKTAASGAARPATPATLT